MLDDFLKKNLRHTLGLNRPTCYCEKNNLTTWRKAYKIILHFQTDVVIAICSLDFDSRHYKWSLLIFHKNRVNLHTSCLFFPIFVCFHISLLLRNFCSAISNRFSFAQKVMQIAMMRKPIRKNCSRDFGQFIRSYIEKAKESNKFTPENQEYWDKQYLALQRLINSDHAKKYQRRSTSTATGLTAEQCHVVLSNEFLELLEKEERSMFRKIFSSRSNKNE